MEVERLERRDLMTATPNNANSALSSQACGCSICTGRGLESLTVETSQVAFAGGTGGGIAAATTAKSPLTSLPSLSSNPNARAKLVLDFNGNTTASWGGKTNVQTPAYDIDGDTSTFSAQELANIQEIWARVAEDYAPFNIDVTTVDPGVLTDRVVAKIAIGGNYSDWFGDAAGGVAYVGGFYNSAPNVGFVFPKALGNGFARYVAEAASHEAGHLFGLDHQGTWSGNTLTNEYNPGTSAWAPIMGVGYNSAVTTWWNGTTSNAPNDFQDDMAILANSANGFGYRASPYGTTQATATALTSGSVSQSGVIAQNNQQHWFRIDATAGSATFSVNGISVGGNFDSVLEVRDSAGNLVASNNPTDRLSSSITTNLGTGTYYVVVKSTGVYGRVGQYTLTGAYNYNGNGGGGTTQAPEISVLQGAASVADGGSVDFGSTTTGTAVTRTFTVRNDGNATLTLSAINASTLPAGFSLVSNLGATTLAAGASTTFTVRLDASAAGNYSGVIRFASNDADEAVYDINVRGAVTAPPSTRTSWIVDNNPAGAGGYRQFGTWTTVAGAGRDADFAVAAPGNGTSQATWSVTGLTAGTYRIAVTWPARSNGATNAVFSFGDEGGTRGWVVVNQRNAASGFSADGTTWQTVANIALPAGRQGLWVRLTNAANGVVTADAVRFERVSAAPVARGEIVAEAADVVMAAMLGTQETSTGRRR